MSKDELFRQSDTLTIHLKLSDRSRGLVGADELALMKPTSWLVNTSRGPIDDEASLVAALTDRSIGGAALDVFGHQRRSGRRRRGSVEVLAPGDQSAIESAAS